MDANNKIDPDKQEILDKGMGCLVIGTMKLVGLLFCFAFLAVFVFLIVMFIHQQITGSFERANRALKEDPRKAAALFAESVRQDAKGLSYRAILKLAEIEGVYALEELIGLIDIPELKLIKVGDRKQMCNVIRQRTAGTTADSLPLDPYASQEVRAEQKRQWQAWLTKAKERYDWQDGKFVPKQRE